MMWYVAIVAVLNLALGYALATFLGAGRDRIDACSSDLIDDTESAEPAI